MKKKDPYIDPCTFPRTFGSDIGFAFRKGFKVLHQVIELKHFCLRSLKELTVEMRRNNWDATSKKRLARLHILLGLIFRRQILAMEFRYESTAASLSQLGFDDDRNGPFSSAFRILV